MLFLNFLKAFFPDIIQSYVNALFEEYSLHVRIVLFIISSFCILWTSGMFEGILYSTITEEQTSSYNEMMVEYFCNEGYIEKYPLSEPLPPDVKKKECLDFYEFECNQIYIHNKMMEPCIEYKKAGKFFYEERISERTRILDEYNGEDPYELLRSFRSR